MKLVIRFALLPVVCIGYALVLPVVLLFAIIAFVLDAEPEANDDALRASSRSAS